MPSLSSRVPLAPWAQKPFTSACRFSCGYGESLRESICAVSSMATRHDLVPQFLVALVFVFFLRAPDAPRAGDITSGPVRQPK